MLNLYDKMVMDAVNTGSIQEGEKKHYKHIGILKADKANVVILFRTVPDEPEYCLVVGPNFLEDSYRLALMRAIESKQGQAIFEFGEYIHKLQFPDGVNMLAYLHLNNFIKKLPTSDIIVTYGEGSEGRIQLDKLNQMIADDLKITLKDLSIKEKEVQKTEPKISKKNKKSNVKETTQE